MILLKAACFVGTKSHAYKYMVCVIAELWILLWHLQVI